MPDKSEPLIESEEPTSSEQPEIKEKVEITQEYLDTLREVVRSVSGDPRIGFKLGNTGEGSRAYLFDAENREIILDPNHIEDREEGIFTAAHEAAHVFMSIGPKEMGLSIAKTHELFSQTGFGATNNALEDCSIGELEKIKFPNLEPLIKRNYDKEFASENANLYASQPGSPEEFLVKDFYFRNGYLPRFIQYGSEVMRDWHQQKFSKKLDEAVEKALKKTIKDARKSIAEVPGPEEKNRKKIVSIAQKRFKINVEKVWPEVKKLVEMDLHTEELRQMVNELMNAVRELMQNQQQKQQAQQQDDAQKEKEADEALQQVEKNIEELGGELSSEAAKEIMDLAKELMEQILQEQQGSQDAQSSQGETGQQAPQEKSKQTESGESNKAGQKSKEGSTEKQEGEEESGGQTSEAENKEPLKKMKEPADLPFPEDKLSEKTKKEIEENWKKVSKKKKEELRQKAQQEIKDFEDKVNEEKGGKLNKDKPKSHSDQDKDKEKNENREEGKPSKEQEEQSKQEQEEHKKRQEKIEEDLRAKLREGMPRYQKIMEEIEQPRDELYDRLRQILRPEEYSGLESGHPSGKILNVGRAMQSERDPDQLRKMWDREYEPVETDNRIVSLIDLSGSMEGSRIDEAEKGVDMAVSALDKLEDVDPGLRNAVIGYHKRVFHYKKMNQRLDEEIQKALSTMPDRTQDTDAGTDTYYGIKEALKEIYENLGTTGNFILNFTDGQSSNGVELQQLLTEGKEERKLKKIKVGLIWIGEGLNEEDLEKMIQGYGYDFGLVMPATKLSDEEKQLGKKDFANAMADLLEDIVKNPDKY